MAKRKRLTPPQETYLSAGLETKSMGSPFSVRLSATPPLSAAPIAHVAAEAAALNAAREIADELEAARAEGRMVLRLPLEAVEADHLVRDRLVQDDEEMATLVESLRARGQQVPIEVVDLGGGRYGLISGWRRLTALRALLQETREPRFATVQALLRRPDTASEAYLAMVEENEIRVGLGHYERARIAARAAEMGVYPDVQKALRHLFQSASRAKRSKIGSFVTLYQALDRALRFPTAIPERLGLALAQAIETDPSLSARIEALLLENPAESPAEEQSILARALRPEAPPAETGPREVAPGLWLHRTGPARAPRLTLSGPALDEALQARLEAWLRAQG